MRAILFILALLYSTLVFGQDINNPSVATNASLLSAGTLPSGRLVGSYTGVTGIGTLSAGAVPTTLLTGGLAAAQFPALSGVITTSAGSLTTGFNSSTGTGAVVLATSPTLVTPILGVAAATSLTLSGALKIASTTVGALPTCNGGAVGLKYVVTDALLPAALATVAAGGAVVISVLCNGANWIVN